MNNRFCYDNWEGHEDINVSSNNAVLIFTCGLFLRVINALNKQIGVDNKGPLFIMIPFLWLQGRDNGRLPRICPCFE